MRARSALRFAGLVASILSTAGSAPAAAPLHHPHAPYGLTERPAAEEFLDHHMPNLGPGISGNWSAVVAFPHLSFKNALGLAPVPGTDRLVVWEREGKIWGFDNHPEVSDKQIILDLTRHVQGWDDCGLLAAAFHPDFPRKPYLYVWYTWIPDTVHEGDPNHRPPTELPNHNRLSRFALDSRGVAVPGSETVLIDQQARTIWHKGGGMFFGPRDGFLYLTIGDAQDSANAQRIDKSLFGGVIRIDVDQRGGNVSHPPPRQPLAGHTTGYFIPNDNPFVGRPGALEEFFALGLRSPHRMTCDPITGRIFIGDVGNTEREEIDVIEPDDPRGLNFQWPFAEGSRGKLKPPFIGHSKGPLIDYNHGEGLAVIGGYVYRGKQWAHDLGGRYIFGDNGNGSIWALDESSTPVVKTRLCTLPFGPGPNAGSNYTGLSSFGLDAAGELYLCQMSSEAGHIYRLQRTGPPPQRQPMPRHLSETGAFANLRDLTPGPALLAYHVNSPLWSDGAVKDRWIALPRGKKIGFSAGGEWAFPPGTVLVKQFDLITDEAHPQTSRRRLETRLLVLDSAGTAYGVTYKWRPDNSDADLLTDGLTEAIPIKTADGRTRIENWQYPSSSDCMRCHTAAAGYVLGPKTRQLNGSIRFAATGVVDNQLRAWNHAGMFEPALDEHQIPAMGRLVSLDDTSAPLEHRVRSYLDSNCSGCHRPGGVQTLWDARQETELTMANIINGSAINRLGIAGAKIVKPGDPDRSLIYRRIHSSDPTMRMPPVGRDAIDPAAAEAVKQWVRQMPDVDGLPPEWDADDVGSVNVVGNARHTRGTFTLTGSGADIWDNLDGFQFMFQPLRGDGTITARIASMSDTNEWAKAGVMIRETGQPGARNVAMLLTSRHGATMQHRADPYKLTRSTDAPAGAAAKWLRLQRRGNTFTGSVSADGLAWTAVSSVTVGMGPEVSIGLAVTAHSNLTLCTAVFDHVTVQHDRK